MIRIPISACWYILLFCTICFRASGEDQWPDLPSKNGEVLIPAQEWPWQPGPRNITVYVRYPQGNLEGVQAATGLMLSMHNWGGTGFRGAPDPKFLVARYNVIVIGVDYVQSGPYDAAQDPPYDFGWYQALDALRSLYFVWHGLESKGKAFDHTRIYATGGSGGGNVSLMVNKLAPRTFACIIDLSGMAKLANDIAFGVGGRTRLNAGYRQDPNSKRYLTPDNQMIRFVGCPDHAATMKRLGNTAKIIVVHGLQDDACPAEDAQEMVTNLQNAGLDVQPHFIGKEDVDGNVIKDCKHSLGDRTLILQKFADEYLLPDSPTAARIKHTTDFASRDDAVRYNTPNGAFVVSYTAGCPFGRFEPNPPTRTAEARFQIGTQYKPINVWFDYWNQ
ncbi:MAG TPA: DUF2920 family protein [Candidatus Hydrogenedentes bacterium]|nr:DUF2920 family protein [Candidatus Hydrogenedentota bacterium]